jgi:hypothetical protein
MLRQLYWRPVIGLFAATALFAQAPTEAQTREANLKAYTELLRKDVRKESRAIFTELMQLSADQAAKFGPIYDEFEKSFQRLNDERASLVKAYAEAVRTDTGAARVSKGLLDLESNRLQLKRQTVDRVAKAIGPVAALRFLEIESQIEDLMDLQANAGLPVVE